MQIEIKFKLQRLKLLNIFITKKKGRLKRDTKFDLKS